MHIKTKWKEMWRKTKQMLADPQPLASTNVAELVPPPPEIRHRNRQTQIEISTIHRSGQKTGSSGLWENRDDFRVLHR